MNREMVARELTSIAKTLVAEYGDRIIAEVDDFGIVTVENRARSPEQNPNFLVVTRGGDWSGFMPLRKALGELDKLVTRRPGKWFAVVER